MKNEKGFSLIELLIVVAIIGIIAAIAIPNLLKSRQAANEAAAISAVRTVGTAQATYQSTRGLGKNFAADLTTLNTEGSVDSVLGSGTKSGYKFSTVGKDATSVVKLIEALEELDDVQSVYANYDIPDEVLEAISAA